MSGDRYKIANQNATYFLTLTVIDWVDLFTRKEYCVIITDSLNYCIKEKGLIIYAYVIMSNHVHLVCSVKEPNKLSNVLRDLKKHTSKQFIKKMDEINESRKEWLLNKFSFEARRTRRAENYKIWKDDNHAIELGEYIDIEQKINYIHNNPVAAMLVYEASNYVFSSASNYADGNGYVDVCIAY
jgi:REP element-mobilizing transposase RayT